MRTPSISSFLLALTAATALACGDDSAPATTTADGGPNNTSGQGNGTSDGMTSMGEGAEDTTAGGATAGDATATGTGAETGLACPNTDQIDGASCTEDCECASGSCFFIAVLGGLCGECSVDADCDDGGCSIPNPLADPPTGSVCGDGSPGSGCETTDVCQDGLQCGTLLDVPGVLTLATCGECIVDADCADGMLCSPSLDILNLGGVLTCVEPGTVANGDSCAYNKTGDAACISGICAAIEIMMLVTLGVCGDCEVDADCMDPQMMCAPADIDSKTNTVIPPTCVPV